MVVDVVIDYQVVGDDVGIFVGFGQYFGVQWDFEGIGQFEEIDVGGGLVQFGYFFGEGDVVLVDDVFVLAGLDEGDVLIVMGRDGRQM